MPSYQSQLGEGSGSEAIAEELAQSQRSISIAEFFEKNKQMLGFDSDAKALVTAVKEAVDNALDATEEAGVPPDIYIEIEESGSYYRVIVEDNGPGITKAQIPKVFGKLLYGSRFHAREQSLTPDQRILVRRNGEIEFIPIGRFCDAYLADEGPATAAIPDAIEAPTFNRDTHETSWQPITHAIRHRTAEQTYKITTQNGRTVTVTGNHSLFSLSQDGTPREIPASDLESGDHILAPRSLPTPDEPITSINVLNYLSASQCRNHDASLFVYGFDPDTLRELTATESNTQRHHTATATQPYHHHNGVDIPHSHLTDAHIERGCLPLETVLRLGWEDKAANSVIKHHHDDADAPLPVTRPIDAHLIDLIATYLSHNTISERLTHEISDTHVTPRPLAPPIQSAGTATSTPASTPTASPNHQLSTDTIPWERFLTSICTATDTTTQLPSLLFNTPSRLQHRFLTTLYHSTERNDPSQSQTLAFVTPSKRLARDLSILWNMQGVVAETHATDTPGADPHPDETRYRVQVPTSIVTHLTADNHDQELPTWDTGVPGDGLDNISIRDGAMADDTVPQTIPGLLFDAGIGNTLVEAATYQSCIESIMAGDPIESSPATTFLRETGLIDADNHPTERLYTLWETIQTLHEMPDSDLCLLRVDSVTETEPPEYVYDISVPGATGHDENFVVANDGAISVKNSRGQQGIGISAAVLYSQLTSGKPAKITSKTNNGDTAQYFELTIDTDTNEPEIDVEEAASWDRPHGTRIELEMEANLRARQQLNDYIKYTAVVNPHARIEFHEPKRSAKFERATDQLPPDTEEIRPHPHGVELGTLLKMLDATDSYSVSGFLQGEFTRVGGKTATNVINNFRDRHYGREITWSPPGADTDTTVESAVNDAVANKSADATAAFAARVAEVVTERDRIAYSEIGEIVQNVADAIEDEFDETFGATVRENAVDGAWTAVTADRISDCYGLVNEATTSRKDDAAIDGLAQRLAAKFDDQDDHRNRVTREILRDFVDRSAEMTEQHADATFGETARDNVTDVLWQRAVTVPDDVPNVTTIADNRDAAAQLLDAMRETDILAPPTGCLAPISEDLVQAGLEKEYDADFYAAATRDAEVHGGDPFVVEAGIAYGGEMEDDGQIEMLRFANRVPLVYQRGACATVDVVKSINWRNYELDQPGGRGMPNGPAVLLVHVASTNVPFTSESKDAIANIPEIEDEIELAIREAARELKSYLNKRRSLEKRRRKQTVIAEILPQMAQKLSEVTGGEPLEIDDSLARIMNNVLVDRDVNKTTVRLTIHNYSDTIIEPDVTEITTADPGAHDEANVVEMDGEWFLKWSPRIAGGETATLEYEIDGDADFDVSIDGVEAEKLTVNA